MTAPNPPAAAADTRIGARRGAALAVLILAVTLLAIDGTVLYLALPALGRDLGPTAAQVLWIGDIYSFVLAGLLITMGNLADRFGAKRLLLVGSAAFGLASLLAAFAPTAGLLILARALLGLAGSTLMPSTLSLIRALFPDAALRTRAVALWSAGAMAGGAVGPLVGGVLLEHFAWGSVFLINLPVVALIIVAGSVLLPGAPTRRSAPIDLLSAGLSVLAIVPLVYAVKAVVEHGPTLDAGGAAAIGVVCGWLFLRRQRRLAQPLFDLSLFAIPAFRGAVIANGLSVLGFFGFLYFFSQYLQLVRGYSPFWAGLAEMPATLASMAVAVIVGAALRRLGAGRAIAAGLLLSAAGLVGIGIAEGSDTYAWLGLALVITGLGTGLAMTLSTDAVVSAAPPDRAGAASAISETSFELGIALGIALLGSLQTALYRGLLHVPAGTPEAAGRAARESLAAAVEAAQGPAGGPDTGLLLAAQEAFTQGMQMTAAIAALLLAAAAVVAWRVIPSPRGADALTQPAAEAQPAMESQSAAGARPATKGGAHAQ